MDLFYRVFIYFLLYMLLYMARYMKKFFKNPNGKALKKYEVLE